MTQFYYYEMEFVPAPNVELPASPKTLVKKLDDYKELLATYIPELDTTKSISVSVTEDDYPTLEIVTASVIENQGRTLFVEIETTTSGKVYGVALELDESEPECH